MIPNAVRRAMYALATSEDEVMLAVIHLPDGSTLRFCSRALDAPQVLEDGTFVEADTTTIGSDVYQRTIISGSMSDDEDGELPSLPLVIDNLEYDAGALQAQALEDATVDVSIVPASDPTDFIDEIIGLDITDSDLAEKLTLGLQLDAGDPEEPACGFGYFKDNAAALYT